LSKPLKTQLKIKPHRSKRRPGTMPNSACARNWRDFPPFIGSAQPGQDKNADRRLAGDRRTLPEFHFIE
jgi:hypothetical protein